MSGCGSSDKDQYGNEVQKLARPLPVEYLLVDLPTSSPLVPLYTFPAHEYPFPVENRLIDGHLQDFGSLHNYMQRFRSKDFLTAMSDFHLLFYLYGLDCFGTKMKTQMTSLLDAVRTQDNKLAEQFMLGDTWSTLEHLIGAHSGHGHDNHLPSSAVGNDATWTCNHCTYINSGDTQACEMCSLPH
ncbi:CLUMA_CG011372, isoform A [Clunio marinus]|uniref:CLUMA_CG011372, isoform A n=1 Tax=Clunio marinus TaxID=568069 RepID=A0A1J1ICS4_9DIPT|nr:CLUMA_CG011372, isoform A [Clunio marinus]